MAVFLEDGALRRIGVEVALGGADLLQGVIGLQAVADVVLGTLDQILDAGDFRGERARADQAHDPGHVHGIVRLAGFLVRKTEGRERGRGRLGIPDGLNGRQFHLLVFRREVATFVTQHRHRQRGGQTERCGHRHRALGQLQVPALEHVPGRDAQHEDGGCDITRRNRVHELGLRHGVGEDGKEVLHLHPHGLRVELCAHRVLHPAVGDQDPECREVRADGHRPGHQQVLDLGQPVPAEEEETHQGRFHEEGHQPLQGQRRSEDVADIVAVVAPVHAELELHHDAGGHTHGKVDTEECAPEPGHVTPDGTSRHHVDRFHDGEQDGQAQRERDEQEVVERCQRKLQP